MNCHNCQTPEKHLWPANRTPFLPFDHIDGPRHWMVLEKCPACQCLWISVNNEPFSSYTYKVYWPYSTLQWDFLLRNNYGPSLLEWHSAVMEEFALQYLQQDGPDRSAILSHDQRLGRHGPFIKTDTARPRPNIEEIMNKNTG